MLLWERSLNLEGFVRHPLMALVIMVEYTVRSKNKQQQLLALDGVGKRGSGNDSVNQVSTI